MAEVLVFNYSVETLSHCIFVTGLAHTIVHIVVFGDFQEVLAIILAATIRMEYQTLKIHLCSA